jgi:hypothetical protein
MADAFDPAALERLEPLIGEWSMSVGGGPDAKWTPSEDGPGQTAGVSVFEWTLGRRFVTQRSEITHPEAPDAISIIAFDADGGGYRQHYFDSRGVVRLYSMTFADGVWELLRTAPDFSPLGFSQRFHGELSDDGTVIEGRWETSGDGSLWELDFELVYRRIRTGS